MSHSAGALPSAMPHSAGQIDESLEQHSLKKQSIKKSFIGELPYTIATVLNEIKTRGLPNEKFLTGAMRHSAKQKFAIE
jgi:hypothetical protein